MKLKISLVENGFDEQPEFVYGEGDGTVNMLSLLELESLWFNDKNQVLKVIKIRGVSHTSILKNNVALEEIIGEISGINSITEYNVGCIIKESCDVSCNLAAPQGHFKSCSLILC